MRITTAMLKKQIETTKIVTGRSDLRPEYNREKKEGGNYSENRQMVQKASCTGLIVGEALLTSTISYMVFAKVI